METKYSEWTVVGNLKEHQLEQFNNAGSCQRACQKLVEEIVKHYEQSDIQKDLMWGEIYRMFDLDSKDYVLTVTTTGEVSAMNKTINGLNDMIKKLRHDDEMRSYVMDKFRGTDESK